VETSIADIAHGVAKVFDREIRLVPGEIRSGGTLRRCPDITKLRKLGYSPHISLADGLARTVNWYREHEKPAPRPA
jgi:UDP-glucose 4-epimerase